ncbi:MAG: AAA family ATPase [Pseudanabaena sp. ELA607]|jgi:AAA15 family ATPase/GTPase
MIKDIEIQNFRCFDQFKTSGFGRINLISGKNSVGKTALLEAILLNAAPRPETVMFLRQLRNEAADTSKSLPERTWVNLFFDPEYKEILIGSTAAENSWQELIISVDESVRNFDDEYDENNDDSEVMNLFSKSNSVVSVLHLAVNISGSNKFDSLLISSNKGILGKDHKIPNIRDVFFNPAFLRPRSRTIAEEFDKAFLSNDSSDIFLGLIGTIDPDIIDARTSAIGEPTLYLQRKNQSRLPIGMFGDAIARVADIGLKIINNKNSILLIDEIENGIHHANQVAFWDALYKLAERLNVQIFATTHSLEMLQSFIEAGKTNDVLAMHFELVRNIKTGKIIAIKRAVDNLDYDIKHGKEVRGE